MKEKLKIFKFKKLVMAMILVLSLGLFVTVNSQSVYAANETGIKLSDVNGDYENLILSSGNYELETTIISNSPFFRIKNYDTNEILFNMTDDGGYLTILPGTKIKLSDVNGDYENLILSSGNYELQTTIISNSPFFRIKNYDTNEILFNMTDDGGYLTVIVESRPAISGEENFVTNVDDAKPLSFFQAYLSAYDETDGDLTDDIYVKTDNYTANKSVLGTHKVIWGVKDSSNNEAILEAYIRVVDVTKPIITGSNSVEKIGYKETYNINNFKLTLTVTDNYDTLTNSDITVKTDGYTSNKTKLGTYNVVFKAVDQSGNEGTFTKPIQVYDNVKPMFSGPTTIATSNTTILTESDVRSQLTASDEIDGNITNKIQLVEDNYTGKGNKVGSYTIKYKVTDNAGNSIEHIVTVNRLDQLPPVIWIQDNVTIKTTPTTPITHEQIIDILQATNQVAVNATTTFRFLLDEYSDNTEVPGVYAISVQAKSADGNESIHNMAIRVLEVEDDGGINVEPETSILDWVKDHPFETAGIGLVLAFGLFLIFRIKRK